ncbi:MAG: chalcone isomerase family protein [Crocinitomicaceae bacterium]|nr:chalcone isomerase family protein [Crocinitomicaceae bacterium]
MISKLLLSTLFILGLSVTLNAQDIESHGVTFPAKMKIGEKVVKYNGSGLREKYFIDLYVGALYLTAQSSDATKIINANEEMCIRLKMVSSKVTRDKFVESVEEGFSNSTTGAASEAEIKSFMKLFSKPFKSGDDIIIIYKPNIGVQIFMNGENLGTQKGLEFKKALWGIWFGGNPADKGLKNAMLGKV